MRNVGTFKKRPGYLLGVDAGGTKTLAAVADTRGRVLGLGRAGDGNYQGAGRRFAQIEIARAVREAMEAAGITPDQVASASYGVAGADREKDFSVIREIIDEIDPAGSYVLSNDTTLILRAGTLDGVGVACVAGTGSNTMGFNEAGTHIKVGGMGTLSGDPGSGGDLVLKGVIAAFKDSDGRGPHTLLTRMFCEALGLDEIADIVEFDFFDTEKTGVDINKQTHLIFKAAAAGDRVARKILESTGKEIGDHALSCLRRLFPDRARPVRLVLGGSVFQKGEDPTMIRALEQRVRRRYPKLELTTLTVEPCVGALLLAYDRWNGAPGSEKWQTTLKGSFARAFRKA